MFGSSPESYLVGTVVEIEVKGGDPDTLVDEGNKFGHHDTILSGPFESVPYTYSPVMTPVDPKSGRFPGLFKVPAMES